MKEGSATSRGVSRALKQKLGPYSNIVKVRRDSTHSTSMKSLFQTHLSFPFLSTDPSQIGGIPSTQTGVKTVKNDTTRERAKVSAWVWIEKRRGAPRRRMKEWTTTEAMRVVMREILKL
jgi:hypothetical protein